MAHRGSQDTWDFISKWSGAHFPYSLNDRFNRYGVLGVLGYIALSTLPKASILEIGCGESSLYLSQLAMRMDRRIYICDIEEGKLSNPMTVDGYLHFDSKLIHHGDEDDNRHKSILFAGPSDAFFDEMRFVPVGLAYIDGDHKYDQAKRDFDNALSVLVDNGYIFLHDTYPPTEEYIDFNRCGDVYRLRQELEKRDDLDCFTFNKLVGCDVGITMVRKKPSNRSYFHE